MKSSAFSRDPERVAPKARRSLDFVWMFGYVSILVVGMILVAGKQRNLFQIGYDLVELRTQNSQLREEGDRLRAELSKLTSPDQVVAASVKLGLVPVNENHRYQVNFLSTEEHKGDMFAVAEE